ncbi:MAG TPA: HAMP domain-containing sensor histidine kinase [Candidatus Acidoferrum sp.]|jgi:two-component system OmpR family sensor kinase|nr:HAMP domain-containing sensor histidine kinase [Candidatus Acidoferrum sp.]
MVKRPLRSFATRLAVAYVGAAIGLLFLIGFASTLFTFNLYARTSNEVIASATQAIHRRIATYRREHVPLARAAPKITADLGRPRVHIAVFDANHHIISGKEDPLVGAGVVGAISYLMNLQRVQIAYDGGLIVVSADLGQLGATLRQYWTLMLPLGAFAIAVAWGAGWLITRAAVSPLNQISAAMQRFAIGDFRPQPLRFARDDEIGELAHAYNGALHQVRSAFAERDRTEAEIRQFIADAGHELRTPLTVIMGYLDVLEDGAADTPGIRERVFNTLRQESRRMRLLIEKLIYLARLERGESAQREIVDVSEIVKRVVAGIAMLNGESSIEVTTAPSARVLADESDISEAVRNLIDNALKYAPGKPVAVSTEIQNGEVVLIVSDRGPGMSEQDQAHAFDRFYRGSRGEDVEGTGLGLAIVKRAVQRSEGSIVLESAQGEGTRFTIRLPRAS